jgi:single-strand DNA-binding protein
MITTSFAGRIGKDAEVRHLQNGDPVTQFSVGCNAGKDKTVWVDCTIFGDRGPKLAEYLRKGTPVGITGRPSARAWKDKSGEARASLQCTVNDVALLGSRGDRDDSGERETTASDYRKASGGGYGGGTAPNNMDDEIPFGPEWR